jgi:hypothetical protein
MNQASIVWTPVIVGLFLISIFFAAGAVFLFFLEDDSNQSASSNILSSVNQLSDNLPFIELIATISVRFLVFTVYPTVALAHANSFIEPMLKLFAMAAPDDFEVLGGKDKWQDFVSSVPAAWTVCGIWITWQKLYAMLSTVFSAVLTAIFTYAFQLL